MAQSAGHMRIKPRFASRDRNNPVLSPSRAQIVARATKERKMKTRVGIMAVAGGIMLATLATNGMAAESLTGAGSTAIYPVLQVWAQKYQQQAGDQMNYQAIGSGGGIKQIDFIFIDSAATEKPLMHDEIVQN